MTCAACGTVNTTDSSFCKHCGTALQSICRACGTANTLNSHFCKSCGTPLGQTTIQTETTPSESGAHGEFREKVTQVVSVLGGLNCGRCGHRTCAENALAIVRGESALDSCVQGGAETARQIRAILGQPERGRLGTILWEQLTSIKLAVILIAVIVLVAIVGTVIPQGKDELFYAERYGMTGLRVITFLQADKLYQSWYFLSLLALLAVNTLACAIKRSRVSWEMIRQPPLPRSTEEIEKLPSYATFDAPETSLQTLEKLLTRRHYRIQQKSNQLWAHKHLWSRLGVDLLHVSLIVVLLGAIAGGIFSFEDFQVAHKGEQFTVARGGFDVRVDDLWTANYADSSQVKDWYTKLTVIENSREVLTKTIEVNEPLTYKGISFYQASFGSDWLSKAELTFKIEHVQESGSESLGEFMAQVGSEFPFDNGKLKAKVVTFYPDFIVTEQGPANRSPRLNNPAAFLEIYNGDKMEFSTWTFAQFPEFQHEFSKENPYRFYLAGMKAPEFTGLQIARNPGIPLIYTGFVLMILGLSLNFYLPPRRIWAAVQKNVLYVGGLGREPREFEPELEEITEKLKHTGPDPAFGTPLLSKKKDQG